MNTTQRNIFLAVIALLVVAVSALGIMVYRLSSKEPAAEEKFIYQSAMHPWIVSDKPGKCPVCGMDLDKRPLKDYLAEKASRGNDSASV
ncbi:MAG: hypothetical protein IAF08_15090, partial [Rhizobacter sp.]|nr:hypothetical protein [Chlorobiales bacterium]